MSFSFWTSAIRRAIVTRMKYLHKRRNQEDVRRSGPGRWKEVRGELEVEIRDKPQLDVDPLVALVLLLYVLEVEVEGLSLTHLSWGGEFLRKRKEPERGREARFSALPDPPMR